MLVQPTGAPSDAVATRARQSLELHKVHATELLKLQLPETLRWSLASDAAVLAAEHHGALALLILNGFYSVAHAVMRPLAETTFRSLWLTYSATYQLVLGLTQERSKPDLDDMARALVKTKAFPEVHPIAHAVLDRGTVFHSFAHAGIHQLTRRRTGFSQGEILAGLLLSDVFASISFECLSVIYDSPALHSITVANGRTILTESHQVLGTPLPGDEWSGALPPRREWPDPL